MKKTSLVLFPVLAALLLAGCTTSKKSGKKKKSSSEQPTVTSTTSGGGGGGGTSTTTGGGGGGGTSATPTPTDLNWDSVSSVGSYFDMTPGSHTATIDFSTEYNTLKAGYPYVENDTPVSGSYLGNLKAVSCGCFCGSYSNVGYLMMKNKDRTAMGAAFIGNYDSLGNITSIEIQRGSSASTKVGYYVYFGNAPVTSQGGMASGTLVTADQCVSLKEVTGSGAYFCVTTSDTSANGQLAKLVIHYTIS